MAEISHDMCQHIIAAFESETNFPLTAWEKAQLARCWLESREPIKPSAIADGSSGYEALVGFAHVLQRWAEAYPPSMFTEPDLMEVDRVLRAAGLSLGNVSGASMRKVAVTLNDLFEPVRMALYSPVANPIQEQAVAKSRN